MPYYLYDGKAAIGPFEPADLAKRPGFGAATMVCPVGATTSDAWKPASSFPELAAALKPPPAPPPAPPAPPPPAAAPPRAEITLILPPERPPEPQPVPVAAPAQPAAAPPAAAAPALASPAEKVVLIVDDDDGIRGLLEMFAQTQGFQVVTAVNGLDATQKLSTRPADLIVTDLMMPGQGGYEFLRSLQQAGGGGVPVFVVTASALDTSTVGLIRQEANVVEFIAKPIRMPVFIAALHKHLKTAPRA